MTAYRANRTKGKVLFARNWRLYVLMIPALVWLAVFMYAPMYGVLLSFKQYQVAKGITFSPWAEPWFKYFSEFFSTSIAPTVIKNTLLLSLVNLLWGFPAPILFALFLNQLAGRRLRKVIQTVSYAPYFVSNVVVVSILTLLLSPSGFVNTLLKELGGGAQLFMTRPQYFRSVYTISGIWQSMGFSAIIYLAALAGISPDLYEAAVMDGATKIQRIRHIDIPAIAPTIVVMLILAVGNLMTVGYEKTFLMQSGMNTSVSEIISTYVYKVGLISAQYSFATAVGLFNSVINFILLIGMNTIARKMSDISIF